jgi:hypothetical protein
MVYPVNPDAVKTAIPLARINLVLRDMSRLFRDRALRPTLKAEITKALAMREAIKKAGWWN